MDIDHDDSNAAHKGSAPSSKGDESRTTCLPEVEIYLNFLVLILLIKYKLYEQASTSSARLIASATKYNRRTLHPILAKIYVCYGRVHELSGTFAAIRGELLAAHRTACLHHNQIGQATILNLLLRSYVQEKHYDQV